MSGPMWKRPRLSLGLKLNNISREQWVVSASEWQYWAALDEIDFTNVS